MLLPTIFAFFSSFRITVTTYHLDITIDFLKQILGSPFFWRQNEIFEMASYFCAALSPLFILHYHQNIPKYIKTWHILSLICHTVLLHYIYYVTSNIESIEVELHRPFVILFVGLSENKSGQSKLHGLKTWTVIVLALNWGIFRLTDHQVAIT